MSTESITLSSSTLSITIQLSGLTITKLIYKNSNDLITGPEYFTPKDRSFQNCIVGRTVNRLPTGKHRLSPEGDYVEPKEFAGKGVSLHGGPNGWDTNDWTFIPSPEAKLFTQAELSTIDSAAPASKKQSAIFSLLVPSESDGYHGTMLSEVVFYLPEGHSKIAVIYRAKLVDNVVKETVCNLTQHWAFNLEASGVAAGARSAPILSHNLFIPTSNTLDLDKTTALPTGSLLPTEPNSTHDRKLNRPIGELYPYDAPSGGIDDFYLFDAGIADSSIPPTFPEALLASSQVFVPAVNPTSPVATVLSSPAKNLALRFYTNQAGVQCYTAPGINVDGNPRKIVHGGSGRVGKGEGYEKHSSCALEFHQPYAMFVHEGLNNNPLCGWNTVLKKGDVYNNYVLLEVVEES